ncbi:MAG: hypothetical protein ACE5K4_06810 [Candidatus Hydrothermarchaeota archaeon]
MKVCLVCRKCSKRFEKEVNKVRHRKKPKNLLAFCPNCRTTRICEYISEEKFTKRGFWSKAKYLSLIIIFLFIFAVFGYHSIYLRKAPHPGDVECTNCHHSLYGTAKEREAVIKIGEAHHRFEIDPSKVLEGRPYPEEIRCENCHAKEIDFEKLHHSIIGYKPKKPSDEICTFCHADVIGAETIPISESTCKYCHKEFPWFFIKIMNVTFDSKKKEIILVLNEIAIKRKGFLIF